MRFIESDLYPDREYTLSIKRAPDNVNACTDDRSIHLSLAPDASIRVSSRIYRDIASQECQDIFSQNLYRMKKEKNSFCLAVCECILVATEYLMRPCFLFFFSSVQKKTFFLRKKERERRIKNPLKCSFRVRFCFLSFLWKRSSREFVFANFIDLFFVWPLECLVSFLALMHINSSLFSPVYLLYIYVYNISMCEFFIDKQ